VREGRRFWDFRKDVSLFPSGGAIAAAAAAEMEVLR
jgi:hypothetical protein